MKKRIAVMGVRGGWSTERLADLLERRTGFRCILEVEGLVCDLRHGRLRHGDLFLDELDALLIKKAGRDYSPVMLDRLQLLGLLESRGVPVFSSPARTARAVNRLSCTLTLREAGVPIPPTLITADIREAAEAVAEFGAGGRKPIYTTKARGMRLVNGSGAVRAALEDFRAEGNQMFYVQKRMDLPGRDLGLVFIGGEFIGAYARVRAADSWNTTTANGGTYAPCDPSPELVELAWKAQAPFGLDVTSVDLAQTPDGPVVFEVSAFGGFKGLWEASGVDAAEALVDHVLKGV